ncbi:lebercilin-like protein [Thamnophis elegans]|uniref:lebercilin-like protein n=1 Tax=Thamnophis elegans TaxID=35005 RepID=UPI001377B06E|nr:lebercilin-like protein [Thamnophis elegans]
MASGSASGVLHHSIQEDKSCGQCRRSNSSGRLTKRTNNSQDSSCSLCFIQSGSSLFNYSSDFHDNTSRRAVNGRKDSICSEENNCGTSQKYCYKDFHSDSSETSTSEECGSFTIPLLHQLETKKRILPEKKKGNDVHPKGGKMLPKRKPKQKTPFITDHINNQEKNNMACRLLSARDHKIKELKNEVAVLQNKLETFTLENKMLKRLQSQHLKTISKYENAEINLPDLLATQSNEVQSLRAHLRKSQEEERRASKKLRDVEVQLLKTKDALQALQKLCEDKKLEERGELQHKLTSLTQKLEASDKKTQDLEKQLLLNTASFRHQLAVEKKKTVEAQSIIANLQVEMESLKQKLKERDRELGIRNIYAHRIRKGHPEKADSCSSPKGSLLNPKMTCNRRPRNRQQGEIADIMGDSVTNYEPSFARFPKERQKDTSSTPSEENNRKIPSEKKGFFWKNSLVQTAS